MACGVGGRGGFLLLWRMGGGGRHHLSPAFGTTTTTTTTTATTSSSLGAVQQQRWYWQEFNRPKTNPQTGKVEYEQPSAMARRFYDDPNIDPFEARYLEYEKPWMARKRKKKQKVYRRDRKIVNELTNYIRYINKHKDDWCDWLIGLGY